MRQTILLNLLAATLLVGACKSNSEPPPAADPIVEAQTIIDKHRAGLAKVLDAAKAVQTLARERPALKPLEVVPKTAASVIAFDERESIERYVFEPGCQPVVANRDVIRWLVDPDALKAVKDYQVRLLEPKASELEATSHALVCRSLSAVRPTVNNASKTFEGGDFSGECRMYSLDTKAYLGGVAFKANLGDEIRIQGHAMSQRQLEMTMGQAIQKALNTILWGNVAPDFRGFNYHCSWDDPQTLK